MMSDELIEGHLYRVWEGHVCMRMYFCADVNTRAYFGESKETPLEECYYFTKWEKLDE